MNAHEHLVRRVWEDQDDVLGSIQLVRGDADLEGRVFHQLVDLLVEGMFLELRQAFLAGELDREAYVAEFSTLAGLCSGAGLLPLAGRVT